jgi:hypothetical protein
MRFASSFVAVLALIVAGAGGCSSPTSPATPQTVTLAPGQTTTYGSLFVRFIGVASDSRCPADVVCIQLGDVFVAIEAGIRGSARRFDLQLYDDAHRVARLDDYTIEVTAVDPYPFIANPIEPDEYRLTIVIARQ